MTGKHDEWSTPAIAPNLRWLFKHNGKTVQLTFDHAQYTVTVERKENPAIGDGGSRRVDTPLSPDTEHDGDAP